METVATIETEAPVTMEETEETTQPIEEAPAVEESMKKEEEKEEAIETKEEVAEADYIKESEELWGQHSEEFGCNYETFRENYTEERENGSDKETAYETVYSVLKKVEESVPVNEYEIIPLDPQSMYATQSCNIRKGPSTDYDKIESLSYAEEVTVIGKVENQEGKIWYVIGRETDNEVQMVSSSLLSTTKPQPATNNGGSTTQSTVDTPPVNSNGSLAGLSGASSGINWDNVEWGAGIGDGSNAAGVYREFE